MSKDFADFETQKQAKVIADFESRLNGLGQTPLYDLESAVDKLQEVWEAVKAAVDEVVDEAYGAGVEDEKERAEND